MQKGIKWNNVYNSYCTNFTDKKITTQIYLWYNQIFRENILLKTQC